MEPGEEGHEKENIGDTGTGEDREADDSGEEEEEDCGTVEAEDEDEEEKVKGGKAGGSRIVRLGKGSSG